MSERAAGDWGRSCSTRTAVDAARGGSICAMAFMKSPGRRAGEVAGSEIGGRDPAAEAPEQEQQQVHEGPADARIAVGPGFEGEVRMTRAHAVTSSRRSTLLIEQPVSWWAARCACSASRALTCTKGRTPVSQAAGKPLRSL